jgi:hypothetical protein
MQGKEVGVGMYKYYWIRMMRLGVPTRRDLHEEICELLDERILSRAWLGELMDVLHCVLRIIHPRLGVLIWPIAVKHGAREYVEYYERR